MQACRREIVLMIVLMSLLAGGCRLPAREWRWTVSGAEPTWLESLGEARGCGVVLRLWAAPRSMWPLPLPGSGPLFRGGEDLFLLALLLNEGGEPVPFDPRRARPAARSGGGQGCPTAVAAGEAEACGFSIPVSRGVDDLELDLRDAVPCAEPGFVFRLSRRASWRWRRVGPGVPGL